MNPTLLHPDLHPHHWLNLSGDQRIAAIHRQKAFVAKKISAKARDKRLELEKRERAFARLLRERKVRWYISFSVKGPFIPDYTPYTPRPKYVWPKLFHSEAEANLAIASLPVFANRGAEHNRGKIISCCVEKVILK